MIKKNNLFIAKKKLNLDERLFHIGLILLPSATLFSAIILLISLISSYIKNYKLFLRDKSNQILIICAFLMILSCFKNSIFIDKNIHEILLGYNQNYRNLFWLDLFNWIPLFLCFWGFQPYLKTYAQRYNSTINLLIGTIPVVISCAGQYFLGWHEPIIKLNGLLVWYQSPLLGGEGVSGLFSNQNYTGFWLSVAWALSIGLLYLKSSNFYKKFFLILMSSSLLFFIILTTSRNAIISSILAMPFIFGFKIFLYIISILLILIFSLFLLYQIYPLDINIIKNSILTQDIFFQLFEKSFKFDFNNFFKYQRIDIFIKALIAIIEKPIFGWGAATFSYIYFLRDPINQVATQARHTHNIGIQLAYNYGLPVAVILTVFVLRLIIQNTKKLILNSQITKDLIIDKTWLGASVVAVFSQIYDITYYDGRVSILIWILLAGMKCIYDREV